MSRLTFDCAIGFEATLRDNPKWQDMTPWVSGFQTNRGRSFQMDNIEAGTATITLDNADGRFTPQRTFTPISSYAGWTAETPFNGITYADLSVSLLVAGAHTTLTNTGTNPVQAAVTATVATGDAYYDAIMRFPMVPVNPGDRMVHTMQLGQVASTDAALSMGVGWGMYDANGVYISRIRDIQKWTVNSSNTLLVVSSEFIIPPGVASVQVTLDDRTGNTASRVQISGVYMQRFPGYMDYAVARVYRHGSGGANWVMAGDQVTETSLVTPNKRVRLCSIMGQNLFPMWLASPQSGREPMYAWNTTDCNLPGTWWGYDFYQTSNPVPIPNAGTTSLRFSYTPPTNTAGSLGACSVSTGYGVYPGRSYSLSFWIRADATKASAPPAGTVDVRITDPNNPGLSWTFASASTIPGWNMQGLASSWFQVTQSFTVPTGTICPRISVAFDFGQTSSVYQNNVQPFGFEIMGLQLQPTGVPGATQPAYWYGDGTEPVFTGYTDKFTATNGSPFGELNDCVLDCSDDLRVCADAELFTPVQALHMRNSGCIVYFPLNDTAASGTFSEVAGGMAGSPAFYKVSTAAWSVTSTAGVSLIGNPNNEGPGYLWGSAATTLLDVSCPTLNGNLSGGCCNNIASQGWSMSFWFNISAGNRPANGTYYSAFSQGDLGSSNNRVGLHIGLYGDASGDYVQASWGGPTWQASVSFGRGALFDGTAHFVQIAASPPNADGSRSMIIYVDVGASDGAYAAWTSPANPSYPAASYIGGFKSQTGTVLNAMVGRLGHFAFYNNATTDPNSTTDTIGRWAICKNWASNVGGSTTMSYIVSWVNPNYPWPGADSGYVLQPMSFSNVNGLTLLQDTAKDLEGAFFFTRYGTPGWKVKSVMDALWSGTQVGGDQQWFSWYWGTSPEPGYSFETDIANIYTAVKGTMSGPSNIVYSSASPTMRQQYGYRELTFSSNLANASDVQARTQTLLSRYSAPMARISDTQWSLSTNDYLAVNLLRLDLLSMVNIDAWPPDSPWTGPTNFTVQKIEHHVSVDGNQCDWTSTLSLQKVG